MIILKGERYWIEIASNDVEEIHERNCESGNWKIYMTMRA